MKQFYLKAALLPDGWASDVVVDVNETGYISRVRANTKSATATALAGHVIAGIPNLHSHAHQRASAGLTERAGDGPDSFWTWRDVMYRCLDNLTPDDLEHIATWVYIEMLKSGYTNVAEFQYVHHDPAGKAYANRAEMCLRTMAAARSAGIGMTCLPVAYAYGGFGSSPSTDGQRRFVNNADQFLAIAESVADRCDGLMSVGGIAPHSLRAVDPGLLNEIVNAVSPETRVHIHISEQIREVDESVAWCGKRPVEWLLEHFDVNERWCLIHATHMTDEETAALARTGAIAGICPTTEANLGDGLFNAETYINAGGRMGIGSDSHISISPVEELRWLEYGQRLVHHARNVFATNDTRSTGRALINLALDGGSKASGFNLGRIEQGYRADLVALDDGHPLLFGRHSDALLDSFIFSGNDNVVDSVVVGGELVVSGGHHVLEEMARTNFERTVSRLALDPV